MKSYLYLKNKFVFLSIGTNIGNLEININKSISLLSMNNNIQILKKSNYYLTEPLYYKDQNNFMNVVIKLSTNMKLIDFFNFCKDIEIKMGRNINDKRNHPRIIDIDILTYDDNIIKTNILTIPHLKICERKFVLKPWSDIEPDFVLPGINKKIKLLLKNVKDNSKIIKLEL